MKIVPPASCPKCEEPKVIFLFLTQSYVFFSHPKTNFPFLTEYAVYRQLSYKVNIPELYQQSMEWFKHYGS